MAAESSNKHKSGLMPGPASCSVCLEPVSDGGDRSIAKLACGHRFHLDCIGSAFNAKGTMQCPNCRRVENGQWLYANGCRQREESMVEDILNGTGYDMYSGASQLFFPHDLMHIGHWCPYQGAYTQVSLSLGDTDHPAPAYADLFVNVLFGEHMGSDSSQTCPFLQAQALRLSRHRTGIEENVAVQDLPPSPPRGNTAVADHGVGQGLPPTQGRRAQRVSMPLAATGSFENGALGGMTHNRQRWLQSDVDHLRATGSSFPLHIEDNGGYQTNAAVANAIPSVQNHSFLAPLNSAFNAPHSRRSTAPVPPPVPGGRLYPVEGQMLPGPPSWDFVGMPGLHDPSTMGRESGHRDGAAFTQWRQEGSSTFLQYPREPELQRWSPPPLSGLYGWHGIYGSDLSSRSGISANQFQGPIFQQFPSPFMAEAQVNRGSFQPLRDPSR